MKTRVSLVQVFLIVSLVLLSVEPALAGGGGGGGGVRAVNVPSLSPVVLGAIQFCLLIGWRFWRRGT